MSGPGPWQLAWRRLARSRVTLAFGALFLGVVVLCLLAPVYAHDIAHTGPNDEHITEVIHVGGKSEEVVSPTGVPIGPTWHSRFLLGADGNGRDVAVRLLYGGRNSLEIGAIATLITMVLAVLIGTLAGWFGGVTDGILARLLDVIWAFPPLLLGVALGVALALGVAAVGGTLDGPLNADQPITPIARTTRRPGVMRRRPGEVTGPVVES